MRSRKWSALGALVALSALTLTGEAFANHAATLTIQVGSMIEGPKGLTAESNHFFPEDLTVHKDDTLKFMGGFHAPLILPTEVADVDAWIAENASAPGQPYTFVQPNPDYPGYELKLLGDNSFVGRTDCGSPDNPCTYTGAEPLDSKAVLLAYTDMSDPENPVPTGFSVTVDTGPGVSFWVIDRVFTDVRMRVTVVNPNEETTTQEAIDAAMAETVAEDTTAARRLHDQLLGTRLVKKTKRGRIFTAYAGYDTENLALHGMYPRNLQLRKGDRVSWRFAQLDLEVHSVTGPLRRGLNFSEAQQPFVCDPNGDEIAGGETPWMGAPCVAGAMEYLLGEKLLASLGDGAVTKDRDFEHSGVRGSGLSLDPYRLRFKKSGTTWKYICAIHPDMRGTVTTR